MEPQRPICFGPFEVNPSTGELRKHGIALKLQDQPAKVLLALLARPGELVTRDELEKLLWADGTFVDFGGGLNAAVNRLRRTLSDSAENPRYIETVARRGYRFVGEVQVPEPLPEAAPLPRPRRYRWITAAAMSIAVAIWLLQARSNLGPMPDPVPLTTYHGVEASPSFSPDGSQVVFIWNGPKRGLPKLYVKAVGSEAYRDLTTGEPGADLNPAWSPDGSQIAFVRLKNMSVLSEPVSLMLVPSVGGPQRTLAKDIAWRGQLSWWPDGKNLVFARPPSPEGKAGLFLISAATGEVRRLTTAATGSHREPAVSPDGKSIAYADCAAPPAELSRTVPDSCSVAVTSFPVGPARRLSDPAPDINSIAWTADSRTIVYGQSLGERTGLLSGSYRLWQVPADGSAKARPVRFARAGSGVAISRSGNRMAYGVSEVRTDIFQVAIPGPGQNVSPLSSSSFDANPRFSPDGKRVAFCSRRTGNLEIWVADADGTNAMALTSSFDSSMPRWSPDGKRIVYDTQSKRGDRDIQVIDATGGRPVTLVHDPANDIAPSFSRDGRWVYFSSNRGGRNDIYRVPATGGPPERVTDQGGYFAFESWDGESLYYTKNGIADQGGTFKFIPLGCGSSLFVRRLKAGTEQGLFSPLCADFVVAQQGIYFVGEFQDQSRVLLFDPASGATRVIATLAEQLSEPTGLAVSPDGKTILKTGSVDAGADLMLVDSFRPE